MSGNINSELCSAISENIISKINCVLNEYSNLRYSFILSISFYELCKSNNDLLKVNFSNLYKIIKPEVEKLLTEKFSDYKFYIEFSKIGKFIKLREGELRVYAKKDKEKEKIRKEIETMNSEVEYWRI